jgi:hypothetical protein
MDRALAIVVVAVAGAASAAEPTPIEQLRAPLERTWAAAEAGQGVAVDATHFYAVANTVIGKYAIDDGQLAGRWEGPRDGAIRHLNSCHVAGERLYCANSNYPEVPMASSIEIFDVATMEHADSHSLGLMEEGSLTFFDPYADGWIAGFAHYDGTGGVSYKGAEYASIVAFDREWRRTGGWLLPKSVQERMAPYAASGGSLGADGLLYVLGHDRPELYVLARPNQGPVLAHIATIEIDAAGQAFAFDRSADRVVYAIDRPTSTVRRFTLPPVRLDPAAGRPFRRQQAPAVNDSH